MMNIHSIFALVIYFMTIFLMVDSSSEILEITSTESFDTSELQTNLQNDSSISHNDQISNNDSNVDKYNNSNQLFPESCEGRANKLVEQPIQSVDARIKKCCPKKEILIGEDGKYCAKQNIESDFNVNIVDVVLYDFCVEDTERQITLDYKIGNPCNISFIYGAQNGDLLFVIQNGSLLIMDEHQNKSYQIINDYCLDLDYNTNELYAIVCANAINSHIEKSQSILLTIFMICSIPCLVAVSYLHIVIKKLRTLHGLSLACLSSSLAVGFVLYAIAQFVRNETDQFNLGYAVQYFILGYLLWLFILCLNVTLTIWIFIPGYITLLKTTRYSLFGIYVFIATTVPLIFVLATQNKVVDGTSSQPYQAWNESIQSAQRYFIPHVTVVLVCCIALLISTYFGFKNIDKILETRTIDLNMYINTKKDLKCISYLIIIITTTWAFEIAAFHLPSLGDYLIMMKIFNALQGVFILMIFVVMRDQRHLLIRWWHDRGSMEIGTEMINLNVNKN